MRRIALAITYLTLSTAPLLAQSGGFYPEAIALVDGQIYRGEDRSGFDTPEGEPASRFKFSANGQPVFCETIELCESSIATALSTPPEATAEAKTRKATGAGGRQSDEETR